ncbi:MAG: LrgB family protein [Beduini sp.]|uniref:LrgB family protein n=1 Tax=Beduini sp. TaxID=1922300 RepID=UPI0011C84922
MNDVMINSAYFGLVLSLLAYYLGIKLKNKTKIALCNPLLIATVLIIVLLMLLDIDYPTFNQGAQYLTYLLTPATVCLALPLYREFKILKDHLFIIFIALAAGCITCFVVVGGMALLWQIDRTIGISLLPKSITTAIAIGLTEEVGGISGITVAAVIITGIFASVIAPSIFKWFHINDPIAQGLALGASGHAIGTSKALELGEIQAAMSSLAIVVTGILTVIIVPLAAPLFK